MHTKRITFSSVKAVSSTQVMRGRIVELWKQPKYNHWSYNLAKELRLLHDTVRFVLIDEARSGSVLDLNAAVINQWAEMLGVSKLTLWEIAEKADEMLELDINRRTQEPYAH